MDTKHKGEVAKTFDFFLITARHTFLHQHAIRHLSNTRKKAYATVFKAQLLSKKVNIAQNNVHSHKNSIPVPFQMTQTISKNIHQFVKDVHGTVNRAPCCGVQGGHFY